MLTPEAFIAPAKETSYCVLEAVPQENKLLKQYTSWKQNVGLHDYELPHSNLQGVVYEIPAAIILAGLTNAFAQGSDVYEKYLDGVILRKAHRVDSVTLGDIVSGTYMNELLSRATTEQKLYGFLSALILGNENPVVFLLSLGAEFYQK